MVTAIFNVSKYAGNSFINCCLKFNNIKQICSKKSLKLRDQPPITSR